MQARSLKHGYSPIGELPLDLMRDLLVDRKRPRRLDGVGRLNETSLSHPEWPSCFLPTERPTGCRNRAETPDRTAEFPTIPQAARSPARHRAEQTRRNDGLFLRRTQIPSPLADRPRCGTPNNEHLAIPSRPGRKRTIPPAAEPAPPIPPPRVENPRRSR